MYHTALPLLALTIPPPSQPLPTPHLFHLTPPPPPHTHTHTTHTHFISSYIRMINVFLFFTLTTCVMVLVFLAIC